MEDNFIIIFMGKSSFSEYVEGSSEGLAGPDNPPPPQSLSLTRGNGPVRLVAASLARLMVEVLIITGKHRQEIPHR